MRYSAFDRELFACVAGIRHFRYMLEGRPFTIYTEQTSDLRAGQGVGAVDGHAVETAVLRGRVHNRHAVPTPPRLPFRRLPQAARQSRQ